MSSSDPHLHPRRRVWGSHLSSHCRQTDRHSRSYGAGPSADTRHPRGHRPAAGSSSCPPVGNVNAYISFSVLISTCVSTGSFTITTQGYFPQTSEAG